MREASAVLAEAQREPDRQPSAHYRPKEGVDMRTTIFVFLVLAAAAGADAQEHEREFGGGFHFWNLANHYDFSDFPTGPTVDLTWVRWGEHWGGAFGLSGVLNRVDVREGNYTVDRRLPVYGHATLRYRFKPDPEGNVWSLGVGTPWVLFWERNHPRIWDGGGGYWTTDRRPEAVEGGFVLHTLFVHTEVLVTRQVSEKLRVRGGVRIAPFVYPLMLQPIVLGVWGF